MILPVIGWTPLHSACESGHLDVAKYLIEEQQCDPACRNNNSWTPLRLACRNGHLEVAKYLIEEEQCDPACKNNTSLHLASHHGTFAIIKFLIEEQQSDFTIKTLDCITPLHHACRHRRMEVVVYMVKECVDILHFPLLIH